MRPSSLPPFQTAASILAVLALAPLAGCKRTSSSTGDSGVVLNEVMARNVSFPVPDAAGTDVHADWAEVHNPTAKSVNLTGYTLSDRFDNPNKFEFPPGTMVPPGGFLVVFLTDPVECSAECEDEPEAQRPACLRDCNPAGLVSGFNLSDNDEGETLFLFAEGGDLLVDRMGVRQQGADLSNGRDPDTGQIGVIYMPTPGGRNEKINVKPIRLEPAPRVTTPQDPNAPITIDFGATKDVAAAGDIAVAVLFAPAAQCPAAPPGQNASQAVVTVLIEELLDERRMDASGNPLSVPVLRRLFRAVIAAPGACDVAFAWQVRAQDGMSATASGSCSKSCEVLPTILISEYQTNNTTIQFDFINDPDGVSRVTPDWIEVWNHGNLPLDIRNLGLAGRGALEDLEYSNWLFGREGGVTEPMPPDSRLVFLADNDERDTQERRQYVKVGDPSGRIFRSTRFRLSAEPDDEGRIDRFAIVRPDLPEVPDSEGGTIIDETVLDFPAGTNLTNKSVARFPDLEGSTSEECAVVSPPPPCWGYAITDCPSFEAPNIRVCEAPPTFADLVTVDVELLGGKRCPGPDVPVVVHAGVNFDQDTPRDQLSARLEFRVDGGPPVVLDRPPAFVLEPAADQSGAAAASTLHSIQATIPGQAQGALVTFSLRAHDERIARNPPPVPAGDPPVPADAVLDETNVDQVAPGSSLRYLVGFEPPAGGPRLNEVLPRNLATRLPYWDLVQAADQRLLEYLEVYNSGAEPQDLSGFFVTDDLRRPRQARFPDGTLVPARGFVIAYFGACPTEEGGQCLVPGFIALESFHLEDFAGTIHLMAPDEKERGANCEVEALSWNFGGFPSLPPDEAGGRICDGEDRVQTLTRASPEATNVLPPVIVDAFHQTARPNVCVAPGAPLVQLNATIYVDQDFREVLRSEPDLLQATFEIDRGNGPETLEASVASPCADPPCVETPPGYVDMVAKAVLESESPFPPVVTYRLLLADACKGPVESETFSFGSSGAARPQVAINEANRTFAVTPAGPGSWIEIHNRSTAAVDLAGAFLSDDDMFPRRAMFPSPAIIPAGGVVVVVTSGQEPLPGQLPVDLGWSNTRGTLFLFDAFERGTCLLDEFPFNFTGLPGDASVGRLPDGTGAIGRLPAPSPGGLNAALVTFVRGDANSDLKVDILDMVKTLRILFAGDPQRPPCMDALDANDDGQLNGTDPVYIGSSVIGLGSAPPPPFPSPGVDPTPDSLPECEG